MAFYGAFSYKQFWNRQFQIARNNVAPVTPTGGGGKPYSSHDPVWVQEQKYYDEKRRLEEKKRANEQERKRKERELAKLEAKRARDLDDEEMQFEVLALLKLLEKLDQENKRIQGLIDFFRQEEEEITILLLSTVI